MKNVWIYQPILNIIIANIAMICFMFEASKKVFAPDPVNPPAARSPSEEMKRMTYLKKKIP